MCDAWRPPELAWNGREKIRKVRKLSSLLSRRKEGESEGVHEGLQAGGDLGSGEVRREGDRGTHADGQFAEMGEAAVLLFHLPDTVQAHRNDGNVQILSQQADA